MTLLEGIGARDMLAALGSNSRAVHRLGTPFRKDRHKVPSGEASMVNARLARFLTPELRPSTGNNLFVFALP